VGFRWINCLTGCVFEKVDLQDLKINRKLLSDANYELLNEYQNSLNILSESKADFEKKNHSIGKSD
jgi:hypothetical protein